MGLYCSSLLFPFLFLSTGVMRLDIFEADLCIVYRREKGLAGWVFIKGENEPQ